MPKIKIGTQRGGAPKVSAKPQAPPPASEEHRKKFPPPNKRHQLPPDLEAELQEALGDTSLDEMVKQGSTEHDAGGRGAGEPAPGPRRIGPSRGRVRRFRPAQPGRRAAEAVRAARPSRAR